MMYNKCLEAEQIQLFINNELSSEEAVRIEAHLAKCSSCRSAVNNAIEFDSKLQKHFVLAHSANSIVHKVMVRVRKLKAPISVSQPSRSYSSFKWLSAFAIALIVFLVIFNISASSRFNSEVGIRFVAADDSSTIDGVRAGTTYKFPLEPFKAVQPLAGEFVFEKKLATDTIVFKLTGNMGVGIASDGLINFSGTQGSFAIEHISGNSYLRFTVNSGDVQILLPEQKLEIFLATKTLPIKVSSDEVVATQTVPAKKPEKLDKIEETASAQSISSDSVQITNENIPEIIHVDDSELVNTEATANQGSSSVETRPNPFVDAPIGIGGAQ